MMTTNRHHHHHRRQKQWYHLPIYLSILHIAIRISLTKQIPINDCDEVYNYWEPLHFIQYQNGLQTWEYSFQYSLRTYVYLYPLYILSLFYSWILRFFIGIIIHQKQLLWISMCSSIESLFSNLILPSSTSTSTSTSSTLFIRHENKILLFHLLRTSISIITSISELYFINTIYTYYSIYVGIYTWILFIFSTGMVITSTSFLPSSTVMIYILWSFSYQIQSWYYCNKNNNNDDNKNDDNKNDDNKNDNNKNDNHHHHQHCHKKYQKIQSLFDKAIIFGLIAILMTGWPFCAILFIPIGIYSTIKTYSNNYHYYHNNNNNDNPQQQQQRRRRRRSCCIVNVLHLLKRVILYTIGIQIIVMMVDYIYYGTFISPTWNIFLYNTGLFSNNNNNNDDNNGDNDNNNNNIGMKSKDELYGVEDISYYIKNLILNWNIAFIMGVLALPFFIILSIVRRFDSLRKRKGKDIIDNNDDDDERKNMELIILLLVPMILWICVVFSRPHKEERFLFPIYPMIAVGTALVIDKILDMMYFGHLSKLTLKGITTTTRTRPTTLSVSRAKILWGVFLLIPFVLFSISRSMVLSDGYTAPLKLYKHLYDYIVTEEKYNDSNNSGNKDKLSLVCVGGEWYRFPSSYHLPGNFRLAFLKSSFGGQLPQQFTELGSKEESLLIQRGKFNDMNQEENDRYVNINECSYVIGLVDHDKDANSDLLQYFSNDDRKWTEIASYKFLDAEKTSTLHRVLYLPFKRKAVYQDYVLFKSID